MKYVTPEIEIMILSVDNVLNVNSSGDRTSTGIENDVAKYAPDYWSGNLPM